MAIKKIYATGRRKQSSARVFLLPTQAENEEDKGKITINGKALKDYFPGEINQKVLNQPLEITGTQKKYDISITVSGGGKSGQAGAVLHGLARALQSAEPELHSTLKKAGFLTRDPRAVERKKPGRHKARKSTQFSKR